MALSERMESTGEQQAQKQKGQGRRGERRISESSPFTPRLPRVTPVNRPPLPSIAPPLPSSSLPPSHGREPQCAVGELTFHRLPSAALIIYPAGVTPRELRWRGSGRLRVGHQQEVMWSWLGGAEIRAEFHALVGCRVL